MPPDRDDLRQRFQFRCGYCGVREADAGAELTADHFQPRSRGGADEPDNLVYSCHACNEFKGDFWDPDPAAVSSTRSATTSPRTWLRSRTAPCGR